VRGHLAALATLAVLAAIAAGCGGAGASNSSSSSSGGAALVPAGALAYVSFDTDLGSDQLQSAQSILDKFPFKPKLLKSIRSAIAKDGVDVEALRSSVGSEVDVAAVQANGATGAVGLTQPKDEQAFDAQLDKNSPPVLHTKIGDWTVFSNKQAFLDAVKNRTGNLSDDASFQAAMQTLPGAGDAIARAYVAPGALQTALKAAATNSLPTSVGGAIGFDKAKWSAGAITAADGAFKLEVHTKTTSTTTAGKTSPLATEIPSGSIVALSFVGGSATIPAQLQQQLGALSTQLGFDAAGLVGALNGPVIAFARPGFPIPEVTLVTRPSEPANTVTAIGDLIAKLTGKQFKAVPTQVDGGTLKKVDLGPVAIYYGEAANGDVVVTDSANALAELKGSAGQLSGDTLFKEAKDAAGMPDGTSSFLYVDLKDLVPAISGIAQLSNQTLPPSVEANLKPLRTLLVFGSRDGDVQNVVGYLKTN
jgi:hypothetical protein